MKRTFGNWFSRIFRGGVNPSSLEIELLSVLVDALPQPMKSIVESQFEAYNSVQREADGRALNFYRIRGGVPDLSGVPLLKTDQVEAPLTKITAMISGQNEPVHAVLTAVNGQAFSVSFSRRINNLSAARVVEVTRVTQSWRSTVANIAGVTGRS